MDTSTAVIVIIAVALVLLAILLWVRRCGGQRQRRRAVQWMHSEISARLVQFDSDVEKLLLSNLEQCFPELSGAPTSDEHPTVNRILEASEAELRLSQELPSAVELHERLLRNRVLLHHCRDGTSSLYRQLDSLLQKSATSLLQTSLDDCLTPLPAYFSSGSGCSLVSCDTLAARRKRLETLLASVCFRVAHQLCCGRDPRHMDGGDSDQSNGEDDADSEAIDVDMSCDPCLPGASLVGRVKRFLHPGGALQRRYLEVTAAAKEHVIAERDGTVRVAPSSGMYSKQDSRCIMEELFRQVDPRDGLSGEADAALPHPSPLRYVSRADDALFFCGASSHVPELRCIRDDAFAVLCNWNTACSRLEWSPPRLRSPELLVTYDRLVKRWAVEVQRKLCLRVCQAWRGTALDVCASLLNDATSRPEALLASTPTERLLSGHAPGESGQDGDDSSAIGQDVLQSPSVVLDPFMEKERAMFVQSFHFSEMATSPAIKCCGSCMPQYLEFEASFPEDPHAMLKLLQRRLRMELVRYISTESERAAASRSMGALKQRLVQKLLGTPSDAAAHRNGGEVDSTNEDHGATWSPAEDDERCAVQTGDVGFHFDMDDVPQPPTRTDDDTGRERAASGTERREASGAEDTSSCIFMDCVDVNVRRCFEEVERLADRSVAAVEDDLCDQVLRRHRPAAVNAVKTIAQELIDRTKLTMHTFASQVVALRRVYQRCRALCSAAVAANQQSKQPISLESTAAALDTLRSALMDVREIRKRISESDAAAYDILAHPLPVVLLTSLPMDSVSGKRVLTFPWHCVFVAYNYYAGLLQKQPITLQFIYEAV